MEFPIYAGIFKFRNARFLLYQKHTARGREQNNDKPVIKGKKTCVLLGKKIKKSGGDIIAGINTWVASDNLNLVDFEKSTAYRVHTVMKGDSLWAIAEKYLGSGAMYPEIVKLNSLNSNTIFPGQKLDIPN